MSFTRTVDATIEPIPLAMARTHCRRGTELDSVLPLYITAARMEAEHVTQRALLEQTWVLQLDEWPSGEDGPGVRLRYAPVLEIVSVTYVDTAGATQTLASSAYVLDARLEPGWLEPADGTEWPETDDVINAITITYKAGYGTTANETTAQTSGGSLVPAPIRRWMLAVIGAIADNPGMLDASGRVSALPARFVDRALDGYIVYDRG